jgi:hypothetical protein
MRESWKSLQRRRGRERAGSAEKLCREGAETNEKEKRMAYL